MSIPIRWPEPRRSYWEGAVLVGSGLLLLSVAPAGSLSGALALPGALICIAAGCAMLLWPGDSRIPQFGALGAILGVLSLPVLALAGYEFGALLSLIAMLIAFVFSGMQSLRCFPVIEGAPDIDVSPLNAAKVAVDEALLGLFVAVAKPPRGGDSDRIVAEIGDWAQWLKERSLRGRFSSLHPEPPDLLKLSAHSRKWMGSEYRHASFDSEYAPPDDMPGARRWLGYERNRRSHAWLLEHPGPARPWLFTIHGYRMGDPWVDLSVFDPRLFHQRYGLNMASIVLPLHGPRRRTRISGGGYLEGDLMDFVHAEMQAMWDCRRLLSWLRLVKHAPSIGVYGVSLGGYNTALLSGLDKGLDCAVAGIPVVDMASTLWRHFPVHEKRAMEQRGLGEAQVRAAFQPVSPLSFKPQIKRAGLGIFAGSIDRLVWPDDPLMLQQHWGNAELAWFEGSHLTFLGVREVKDLIESTLTRGGLISEQHHGGTAAV